MGGNVQWSNSLSVSGQVTATDKIKRDWKVYFVYFQLANNEKMISFLSALSEFYYWFLGWDSSPYQCELHARIERIFNHQKEQKNEDIHIILCSNVDDDKYFLIPLIRKSWLYIYIYIDI